MSIMVDLDLVKEAGLFEAFDVFVIKPTDDYEEKALEMALNDCKFKHNGCDNCTRECMWRE